MEVYLNVAETGIGTYGANAGSQRYFGHDASAMSATEAARIAAILPLAQEARRDRAQGLHAPLRQHDLGAHRAGRAATASTPASTAAPTAPRDKAPPPSKAPRELPGEEYETATPPPPEPTDAMNAAGRGTRADQCGRGQRVVPVEGRRPVAGCNRLQSLRQRKKRRPTESSRIGGLELADQRQPRRLLRD